MAKRSDNIGGVENDSWEERNQHLALFEDDASE
jgi:hypothetical protein